MECDVKRFSRQNFKYGYIIINKLNKWKRNLSVEINMYL